MRRRCSRPVIALAALLAAVLAACGGGGSTTSAAPSIEHVHGIAIDPADRSIIAATHDGLYRIVSATAVQQIGAHQDTMGFTVTGAGEFLGSGHPAPGTAGPPNLGLIESRDRGEHWTSLSLAGEVDFHALESVAGVVYGWDATTQRLMHSADKKSWTTMARITLADFAVNPGRSSEMLATTQQGLLRSANGGRTWAAVPRAPLLLLVVWSKPSTAVGIAPDGNVWRSADDARTWAPAGSVAGQPEAMGAAGASLVVATDQVIAISTDGGDTWQTRYAMRG